MPEFVTDVRPASERWCVVLSMMRRRRPTGNKRGGPRVLADVREVCQRELELLIVAQFVDGIHGGFRLVVSPTVSAEPLAKLVRIRGGRWEMSGGVGFRGLFVGVDRYQHSDIDHLKSAVRDARALHALFADNLGESATTLVVDKDATRARLVDEIQRLAATSTDEGVVVIAFSGHGSDTHELVTYDADPWNLRVTGLR